MSLELAPRLDLQPTAAAGLAITPTPVVIAAAEMLSLSTLRLDEMVAQELADNPALEQLDSKRCRLCTAPHATADCWMATGCPLPSASAGSGSGGVLLAAPEPPDARTQLLTETNLLLEAADRPIAQHVVGNLSDRGRLELAPDQIADELGVNPARVGAVIAVLREVGPPGIAATTLKECLLVQIEALERVGCSHPLARHLIEQLPALGEGRIGAVAEALGASRGAVTQAAAFIRDKLRPYPGLGFEDEDLWSRPRPVRPEIVVREVAPGTGCLQIELVEPHRLGLRLNSIYVQAARRIPSDDELAVGISAAEATEVARLVRRGRTFLARLAQRWATLRAVAGEVIAAQQQFVLRGPTWLRPLTRIEVADALGVHESTVSRAVAGRHVLLPDQRLVPFAQFFDSSLPARTVLGRLIAEEDQPLSDSQLAGELARRGYPVARRTVTKYRQQLGLPSCRVRASRSGASA